MSKKFSASQLSYIKDLVRNVLNGEIDLLVACRDLAGCRDVLALLPDNVVDVIIAVSSEIDGIPLGAERKNWSAEALRTKDMEAAEYREVVRPTVIAAVNRINEIIQVHS